MLERELEGLKEEYGREIEIVGEYNDNQNIFDFAVVRVVETNEKWLFNLSTWEEEREVEENEEEFEGLIIKKK